MLQQCRGFIITQMVKDETVHYTDTNEQEQCYVYCHYGHLQMSDCHYWLWPQHYLHYTVYINLSICSTLHTTEHARRDTKSRKTHSIVLPDITKLLALCKLILKPVTCYRRVATAKHPATPANKQSSNSNSDMKTSTM